ncbi:hypothetical protein HII28_05040 [Planctomonas sp. JC2975]|uniref:DUF6264 family protein n=1 Tax=Planctomonas sp. JC2975 TaxID=2729626 RepID=UPI0014740673|nr:DUF6264 family protein [Planctomonas sp. JC2975]NNC11244.1 hypothetical protein [Planctomonas sp. JC2975]
MNDTGSRPRPQYGEYATPEEQRAAIKAPETNPHYAPPEPGHVESTAAQHPSIPDAPARQNPPVDPDSPSAYNGSTLLRHPADRVITIALLVLGLYNVITTITSRSDLPSEIAVFYGSTGITGDYTVTSLTGTIADVIAIVSLALWVVAAGLSTWTILRGRIAFWIPLVAGVLASLVNSAGLLILVFHDPAFIAFLHQAR